MIPGKKSPDDDGHDHYSLGDNQNELLRRRRPSRTDDPKISPPRMMREVLHEIPLADETNGFVEWMNRQGIDRQTTGAIGPSSLFFFLIGWCESHTHSLTSYIKEQFAGTQDESISQAIRSLEPYESSRSGSAFPYLTQTSEEVLRKGKQLVEALRRQEIQLHHLFAAFLLRAAETKDPDEFLGLSDGRVDSLRRSFLGHIQESGYGEAWKYWTAALGAPTPSREKTQQAESSNSVPPSRKLKSQEIAELSKFFEREKIKLSYAVTSAITNGAEAAAGFAEVEGTCTVGGGILFLGFLEVAANDRGKDHEGRSLPIALVRDLNFGESKLKSAKAHYFAIQNGFDNDGGESGLVWGRTFHEAFKTALGIQQKCSPSKDERWVSARHLIAALLTLDAEGGAPSKELQNVGFESHLVAKTLREHLPIYKERDSESEWEAFFLSLPESSRPKKLPAPKTGLRFNASREAKRDELCLDIEAYSRAIAATFEAAVEEDDFIFALYAPWGRGKSTLIKEVARILGGDQRLKVIFGVDSSAPSLAAGVSVPGMPIEPEPGRGYEPIFFSAWKYPTRPEVWVHLYQKIAMAAQAGSWTQKLRIGFRVSLLQHGWWPLLGGFALFALSRIYYQFADWLFNGLGFLGLFIAGSFVWTVLSKGKHFGHSYFSAPDHAEKLGMQATIGHDLKKLLRVWVAPKRSNNEEAAACDFSRWPARLGLIAAVALIWLGLGLVGLKLYLHLPEVTATDSAIPPGQAGGAHANSPLSVVGETINSLRRWPHHLRMRISAASNVSAFIFAECSLAALAAAAAFMAMAISRKPQRPERVLLVVDDLDRCEPAQMLSVIESLRLFLDDAEMSRRLQVAMLLDREIFKRVIIETGRDNQSLSPNGSEQAYFREQEEKLFVASLSLPPLNARQVEQLGVKIIDREYYQQLHVQLKRLRAALPPEPGQDHYEGRSINEGFLDSVIHKPDYPPPSHGEMVEWQKLVDHSVEREKPLLAKIGEYEEFVRQDRADRSDDGESITFYDEERSALKSTLSKLHPSHLTPRSLRSFVIRYQLVRLVLRNLGQEIDSLRIATELAAQLYPTASITKTDISPTVRFVIGAVSGEDL